VVDGNGKWVRDEVWALGRHIATVTPLDPAYATPTTFFVHSDWLVTEREKSDVNGWMVESCNSDVWGAQQNCYQSSNAPSIDPDHFTGKERDTESGNDYFGARYYASTMGRWLSPDWSEKPTAVPYADFTNPQSLNLYQYEGNNPLAKADKDGHCWPVCTVLAGAAVGALTGGAIEAGAEYFTTGKVNWNKVGNAAVAGLVTGAIVGAAGPEAGLAAKAVIGAVGGVAGGAFERTVNGEKAGDVKAIAIDAAAGAVSPKIEAVADRTFATEAISKTVSKATDATVDAGRRMSDSGEQPKPQQSQPQQQQPQQQHKTCSSGTSGCS